MKFQEELIREKIFFTTNELSSYLHVSTQTINKKRKAGELPYFKIGRKVFFRKEKIDLWINNQELKNVQPKDSQTEVKSIKE